MGLFDDDTSRKRDEVRIGVSEEDGDDSRLRDDVESRVGNDRSRDRSSDSNVSLEDIHEQNERIIELLEEVAGRNDTGNEIGDPESISDRRGNRNDSRKDTSDDQDEGMRGGMDELL